MRINGLKRALAALCAAACLACLAGCSLFYLTRRQAVRIALDNEGISGDNCTFVSADLVVDDGGARWEIEFYKDSLEYDYTIDARTGDIIEFDHDIDGFTPATWPSPNEGIAL